MSNLQKINEDYNDRITRRLEYLSAVTGSIAVSEGSAYAADNETDALVAIGALNLIKAELDEIIQEMGFMSSVLLSVDQTTMRSARAVS